MDRCANSGEYKQAFRCLVNVATYSDETRRSVGSMVQRAVRCMGIVRRSNSRFIVPWCLVCLTQNGAVGAGKWFSNCVRFGDRLNSQQASDEAVRSGTWRTATETLSYCNHEQSESAVSATRRSRLSRLASSWINNCHQPIQAGRCGVIDNTSPFARRRAGNESTAHWSGKQITPSHAARPRPRIKPSPSTKLFP